MIAECTIYKGDVVYMSVHGGLVKIDKDPIERALFYAPTILLEGDTVELDFVHNYVVSVKRGDAVIYEAKPANEE